MFERIYKSTFNVRYDVISSKRTSARFRKMFTVRVVAHSAIKGGRVLTKHEGIGVARSNVDTRIPCARLATGVCAGRP